MSITRDVVLKTAALAHLDFLHEDVDHFAAQMSEILDYMECSAKRSFKFFFGTQNFFGLGQ